MRKEHRRLASAAFDGSSDVAGGKPTDGQAVVRVRTRSFEFFVEHFDVVLVFSKFGGGVGKFVFQAFHFVLQLDLVLVRFGDVAGCEVDAE